MPTAASNLFTFLAMRLQQSFMNLNCGTFGMNNDVSTTADGNGVVVAACFVNQVARHDAPARATRWRARRTCPATTSAASRGRAAGRAPVSLPRPRAGSPSGMSHQGVRNYWHRHHHG